MVVVLDAYLMSRHESSSLKRPAPVHTIQHETLGLDVSPKQPHPTATVMSSSSSLLSSHAQYGVGLVVQEGFPATEV